MQGFIELNIVGLGASGGVYAQAEIAGFLFAINGQFGDVINSILLDDFSKVQRRSVYQV
jgi:hypothetical protein